MTRYQLLTNYATDDARREQLYPLFERAFGIPPSAFQDYYARGFWNPTYRPYTLFDDERAIANASRYTLPLMIGGQRVLAAGIQSVMTDPDYRGQGLMKQVFTQMLHEIDQEFDIAFLQTEIPDLYTPFGFRLLQEHRFVTDVVHTPTESASSTLRPLDFFKDEDLQMIQDLLQAPAPLSRHFAPLAYASSLYLNLYEPFYHQMLYVSEALRVLLVFRVEDGTLKLFDVIGRELPALADICREIAQPFNRVEFHFHPEQFTDRFDAIPIEHRKLMVRGDFALEQGLLRMPITANF